MFPKEIVVFARLRKTTLKDLKFIHVGGGLFLTL